EIVRNLVRASLVAAIENLRLVEEVRDVERELDARTQLIRHADIHGLERFTVAPQRGVRVEAIEIFTREIVEDARAEIPVPPRKRGVRYIGNESLELVLVQITVGTVERTMSVDPSVVERGGETLGQTGQEGEL